MTFVKGVEDNGRLAGLSTEDMKASLKTLHDMASRLGATTSIIRERVTNAKNKKSRCNNKAEDKSVVEVLVRKLRKDDREDQESIVDLRIAVMGVQDAGKSTLLGKAQCPPKSELQTFEHS